MDTKPRAYPPDGGLKEPVRSFEETFSGEQVVLNHFFPDQYPNPTKSMDELVKITKLDLTTAESRGYGNGYINGLVTGVCGAILLCFVFLILVMP